MRLQTRPSPSWLVRPFRSSAELGTAVARGLVERLFRDHPTKKFAVRLWDGTEVAWRAERDFTLVLRDAKTFVSLAATCDPSEFAEAYVDERLDIEGDVDAAVGLASYLRPVPLEALARLVVARRHASSRARTRADDARDVRAHYDLSNDFFRLFLDSRMVYSCAYFERPAQSLDEAQERKLDLVCRKLCLQPGESLLDVGCGWGALVIWAAERYGVQAVGITLSPKQADEARARVAAAGLSRRVTIEERRYEDLPVEAFDKIASVGMVEHVGIANLGTYFARLHGALRPGGLILNHGITQPPCSSVRTGGEFVRKHVFPGSEIDDLAHTLAVMQERGLEILDVQSLRPHYALTLAAWGNRYAARRAEAARMVPRRVMRAWDLYLPGCRRAFEEGLVSVHQCLAAKPDADGRSAAPFTREQTMLA